MIRRLTLTLTILATLAAAAPATAQSARATGIVRDTDGKAVKSAVVTAFNPDAYPSNITSTTDDRGRWGMVGLRTGEWTFVVQAPGYVRTQGTANIRVAASPPLQFTMAKDPGIPGALDANVQKQLAAANALRDEGRYEQALAAYQEIRTKNPKLSTINMVIAGVYRTRAARETDAAVRRTLLTEAIGAYTQALQADPANERAKAELAATRAEADAPR